MRQLFIVLMIGGGLLTLLAVILNDEVFRGESWVLTMMLVSAVSMIVGVLGTAVTDTDLHVE